MTDSVLAVWRAAPPQRLWRRHADAVNRALVERWLPPDAEAVLKTDLWDEAVGEGLYPTLAERGREVVGIDASADVIAEAASRYDDLVAIHADVRRLPFPAGRFDAVISNSTLDHFDHPDELVAALRELRRVLRPGGRLVLTLDNPANPLVALLRAFPRRRLNRVWIDAGARMGRLGLLPYHVGTTLGHRRLAETLEREGFEVSEVAATVHAPRAAAVVAASVIERRAGPAAEERFLRALKALERLGAWPTRFITGHFVAVSAVKGNGGVRTVAPGSRHWTARSALLRARGVLADEGVGAVWFRVLSEIAYRRLELFEIDVREAAPVRDAAVPLSFGFLSAAEADEYTNLRSDVSPAEVLARLGRGERCFVARHDGRLVSARWVATDEAEIEYLGLTLPLGPGEAWVYESYTHPEERGHGVSSAAGTRLVRALADEGVTRVVAGLVPESRASVRTFEKTGFRRVGSIGYVRLGPWRRRFLRRRPRD